MRYCPNCGEKIERGQLYCNNCGINLNETHPQHSRRNRNQNTGKVWIIIAVVLVALIAVAIAIYFLLMFLKNPFDSASDSTNHYNSHSNKVNVLSTSFSENFMNQENTGGYKGFELGMSPKEIKHKFGNEDGTVELGIGKVHKYGNMGVYYGSDNTVSSVYVLPDNVTVDEFKKVHGEPTKQTDDQMIYDDNPDNGFTIFINHKDDKIQSVENTFQMDPSSLKQINSSNNSSQNVSEAFSQDVLNYSDGISKIMNTAFSAADYTDQPASLSKAKSMTASWDGLLNDIENQADTDEEQRIVKQLQGFKNERDEILDDIGQFVDDHDSEAWHNAQKKNVSLEEKLKVFFDEFPN